MREGITTQSCCSSSDWRWIGKKKPTQTSNTQQYYEGEHEKKELNQTSGSDVFDKVRIIQRTLVRIVAGAGRNFSLESLQSPCSQSRSLRRVLFQYRIVTSTSKLISFPKWVCWLTKTNENTNASNNLKRMLFYTNLFAIWRILIELLIFCGNANGYVLDHESHIFSIHDNFWNTLLGCVFPLLLYIFLAFGY